MLNRRRRGTRRLGFTWKRRSALERDSLKDIRARIDDLEASPLARCRLAPGDLELPRELVIGQNKAGLGSSPRTLLEEFGRIRSVDVVLPLEKDRELRLRCVVRPDKAQAALLDRLGLRLPRRLKVPRRLSKM